MKRMMMTAVAALGMVCASVSFADALNGAAGKKIAAANDRKVQPKLAMVDVLVLNRSDNGITLENPPSIRKFIASGDTYRLPSNNYGNVRIQIINNYNNAYIFSQDVCNRAIVTVRGRYSDMSIFIDTSDCFK